MRVADLHARSRAYQAFVFDMDGVVTDTATVHAAVWKTVLDEVLTRIGGSDQPPFDPVSDYRTYIDGRTREDGIRCFLAARGLKLPEGSRKDGPHRMTIKGLAARKQQLFAEEIARSGVSAFPDAAELLAELNAKGIPTALVTASRNSSAVLELTACRAPSPPALMGSTLHACIWPANPTPRCFLKLSGACAFNRSTPSL